MEDLILTDKIKLQLRGLIDYLAEQETVFHRWGASKVRARGFGIKALFSGGPGTGKTMAAEVIAGSLGLDLFRVDLSSVISRWVGETEKNLKRFEALRACTGDGLMRQLGKSTEGDHIASRTPCQLEGPTFGSHPEDPALRPPACLWIPW